MWVGSSKSSPRSGRGRGGISKALTLAGCMFTRSSCWSLLNALRMISNIIFDGICADCAFLEIHVSYGLAIATQLIRFENITLLDYDSCVLCRA